MSAKTLSLCFLMLTCLMATAAPSRAADPNRMPKYASQYYVIYSDIEDKDLLREASIRMSVMAEQYYNRTKDFGGKIATRLPFYLFAKAEDYQAASGVSGSVGVFNGKALMAIGTHAQVWHIVQHEGFHQFVHSVIGGRMPPWVNEGMAEYFGEGVWTGDGLVVGGIPADKLKYVQNMIDKGEIKPFMDMVMMDQQHWNGALNYSNYAQAWSMIHFLVHSENGKYQGALTRFISEVSHGKDSKAVFLSLFGRDTETFQKKYVDWWKALSDPATPEVYARANVATFTSFLARSFASGQKFDTVEDFFKAAADGKLQNDTKQWLPAALLKKAVEDKEKVKGVWSFETVQNRPRLVLTLPDGTLFTGSFVGGNRQCGNVECKVTKPKAPTSGPATTSQPTTRPTSRPAHTAA